MVNLFRMQLENRKLPKALRREIERQAEECQQCYEHPELPRTPKVSLPTTATPNIAVSLDFMPRNIAGTQRKFLIMLD